MIITRTDRLFYAAAMEYMIEKFEITRSFTRYNGFASFPADEMSDLVIGNVKRWLLGAEGEEWLSTIGYYKKETPIIATISGTSVCHVCSGTYMPVEGLICEKCGKPVCSPCITVVDPHYHIGWCNCCVESESLTNLLGYNE
jgi:hypothetical protein